MFERNLGAIRKRNAHLATCLEEASTEGIEIEIGPRGASILRQGTVRLGSAYDPAREAQQMAGAMAEEPADVMVAIGFGLGEQFEPYLEQNPGTLIIFEPSIARLKAALERISIVNLLAKHRDLYIVTDLTQLNRVFSARYAPALRARVFPHPAVLRLDRDAVAEAVEWIRRAKDAVDARIVTSIEMLMPWAWITAQNGERIASTPNFGRLQNAFRGRPAVVVAAGPSLDKQLPLLREVQDRIVIIAIGQTVKSLRAAGIEPHLVHVLESRNVSHQLTEGGDSSTLCTAYTPDCHPAVFDTPTRAKFCAVPSVGPMGVWIAEAVGESCFTIGGGTVAQGAVGLGAVLGCDPISLIGQDLAFTDGRAYAKDSAYGFVELEETEDGRFTFNNMIEKEGLLGDRGFEWKQNASPAREVVWVDGWNEGERVQTWSSYAAFIEQYRDIGLLFASRGLSLVNCTEGGARIPEVEHRSFEGFLEDFAVESFPIREVIVEAHDSAPHRDLTNFETPIADARRILSRVEEETRKARRFARNARERLEKAKSDQQRLDVLKRLARFEKKVRRHLEKIPWLDALVQPEIYNSIAAFRRSERLDPTDGDLAEESVFLLEATKNGIKRARDWFEAFEASFASGQGDAIREAGERPEPAAPRVAQPPLSPPS